MKYRENVWAALRGALNEITQTAVALVIDKYSGVLAGADAFTLNRGYGSQAHR